MTQTTDNIKKFKIYSLRTVKSPSIKDVTTYNVLVGFMDLPTNIPMDVNPKNSKDEYFCGKTTDCSCRKSDARV